MSDSTDNSSKPSREQLEARVVAMLLGEASPFEEEQLRKQLKTDTALARFCAEIEKTLPLLKEAFDVGRAGKVKSPKPRLAGKRRSKLKQLFRSETGLAKRRIVRLNFRKTLAIAAAVCVVLFVAAGLLLPRLPKSMAALRADVAGVDNYARVEGVQVANGAVPSAAATSVLKRDPSFDRDHVAAEADFLGAAFVEDRAGTLSLDLSIEEVASAGGGADRLAAATELAPARGMGFGTVSGKELDGRLALSEQWAESATSLAKPIGGRRGGRARNRSQSGSKRELADLVLPELKSEDRAESPDTFADFGMYAGFRENAEKGGSTRSLLENQSNRSGEDDKSVLSVQKNLLPRLAQPTGDSVPGFENSYATIESSPSAQPKDGEDLYWFRYNQESEPGEPPVMVAASPEAATKSGVRTFSVDSLHSISETRQKGAGLVKSPTLPRPTAPPTHRAGDHGIDDNGRAYNRRYESAYRSGLNSGANAASGGQAQSNWNIQQRGEEESRQWGASRADVASENRNQPTLPGSMGAMGGGGFGGFGGAYADDFVEGQPIAMGVAPAGPVSGEDAGALALGFDVDGDGGIDADGKLYGFGRGRAEKDSTKTLGSKGFSKYSGRSTLESNEGESEQLGQALSVVAAGEVASEPVNELKVRGLAGGKLAELEKFVERDQPGAEGLYFERKKNRAATEAPAQETFALGVVVEDEAAKESGQAETLMLGDDLTLGRMFKKQSELGKAARELSAVQSERTADAKTLKQRGWFSRDSARQSLSRAKEDKDVLADLPAEEHESLTVTIDGASLVAGSDRQQRLAEKNLDESRRKLTTRQPQSLVTADREMLRRKGKPTANKELRRPSRPRHR